MIEAQKQKEAEIARQCLRAALRQNNPWAARNYQRMLSKAEEALAELRRARLTAEAEQAAFGNEINPS